MKYLTGYVWAGKMQQDVSEESLCLLQVCFGKTEVVLACICDGGAVGGNLTKQLKLWLADRGEQLFGKKITIARVEKEFTGQLQRLYQEAQSGLIRQGGDGRLNLSGILIVGQDCLLMQSGDGCICLMNRRFQRTHRNFLTLPRGKDDRQIVVAQAQIQRKVGILIGREYFLREVPKEAVLQCMAAQEIIREPQIERRLQEMMQESRRKGVGQECSVIYIRSLS